MSRLQTVLSAAFLIGLASFGVAIWLENPGDEVQALAVYIGCVGVGAPLLPVLWLLMKRG